MRLAVMIFCMAVCGSCARERTVEAHRPPETSLRVTPPSEAEDVAAATPTPASLVSNIHNDQIVWRIVLSPDEPRSQELYVSAAGELDKALYDRIPLADRKEVVRL